MLRNMVETATTKETILAEVLTVVTMKNTALGCDAIGQANSRFHAVTS
jgi:hypothetical protein